MGIIKQWKHMDEAKEEHVSATALQNFKKNPM